IEKIISEILESNQKQVEQYKGGQEKLLGFFVGQVMKATQGKASPGEVNKLLKKMLSS
ncbi:MAG: Asp-tRNA(Asn)/Glu-tRNA(Gln) amidotransferase GatCAB subunit B, partial [Gammaproteobacteria bacterium]